MASCVYERERDREIERERERQSVCVCVCTGRLGSISPTKIGRRDLI